MRSTSLKVSSRGRRPKVERSIVVSHDRDRINAIAHRSVELTGGRSHDDRILASGACRRRPRSPPGASQRRRAVDHHPIRRTRPAARATRRGHRCRASPRNRRGHVLGGCDAVRRAGRGGQGIEERRSRSRMRHRSSDSTLRPDSSAGRRRRRCFCWRSRSSSGSSPWASTTSTSSGPAG